MKLYNKSELNTAIIFLSIFFGISLILTYLVLTGRFYSSGNTVYFILGLSWALSIFGFILFGFSSIVWCTIDDEKVSSFCLFKKIKSYKWPEIKSVKLERVFLRKNNTNFFSEALVFYNGKETYLSNGNNSLKKPITCYVTSKNYKAIENIIDKFNLKIEKIDLSDSF